MMSQLVAALDDERQSIVVVGSQLVTMQDHNLGPSHLLLMHTKTWTLCRQCQGVNIAFEKNVQHESLECYFTCAGFEQEVDVKEQRTDAFMS